MDNSILAEQYMEVASIGAKDLDTYRRMKEKIQSSEVKIYNVYQRDGSLKELCVEGIGSGTKKVLEEILNNGIEKAKSRRLEKIRKEAADFSDIPDREPKSEYLNPNPNSVDCCRP